MSNPSQPLSQPVLGVSTGIWWGERVLVVRRGQEPAAGKWSFPGGKVEFGEKLADAALREALEETGITPELAGFVDFIELFARGQHNRASRHVVLALFAGRALHDQTSAGSDASEAKFVTLGELEQLDATPGLHAYALRTRAYLARLAGEAAAAGKERVER